MSTKSNKNYDLIVNGNLKKVILILAIPAIVSMLVTSIYNAADTYFVSKFGDSAVAGVSVVMSYMSIVQAVGFFFGHGSGNFISKSLGAKDEDSAGKMAITSVVSSFVFGLIIMAFALIFIEPIAKIFSTETMLEHTKNYFFYIILATPFMTASFTLNNQLRFQGNAFYGMLGLGFGAILNIILDPIIISLTGDVSGASIATMISQIVGFILLILFSFKSSIKLSLKNLAIKKSIFLEIFKGGLPSLLRQGTVAVSNAVLSLIVVKYGDYAVAGISVAGKVSWIFFSILIGFGQGFQPVCGFNYGAGKMDRVKSAFKFSTIVATLYMALITIVCMVFSKQLISLFNTAEGGGMQKAIELGSKTIFYHAFAFPLAGLYTTSNMMMQNIGRPVRASILALMRQGLAFIPSILILPSLFSLTGVMLAQPVADLISFIVCIPILISVLNEIKKATENNAN